ncbi:MAG: tetratricopeptide repeat protein [Phycisphaerales bacterium]|nr:tetratricopeptide repeat protein [Phycisphaerales bacterium]
MNDWVDAEHHVERAHEHYDAGRWDEAENELRQALSLNPYQAEWYFNLGLTLEAAGRHGSAAEAFNSCFKLHKDEEQPDPNSALLAGLNLVRDEKPEQGLSWFDRVIEIDPTNITAFVHRIEVLIELGRHDEAEEAFYLAQQVDPEHGELYATIADSLMLSGHHERAVWCLREAARLDPELLRIQAKLAKAYAASGRLERARQLYLRELRLDPGDIDTLLDIGELLLDMHRLTDAGEKFRRVLELESDQPDAHFLLGELAEQEQRIADALVHYDVVLRLDKAYPYVRRRLARVLILRNREEDAPRIRDLLGFEHREVFKAKQKKQVVNIQSSLKSNATEIEDLEELGRLLLDTEMITEATKIYTEMIDVEPQNHKAYHGLSVAMLEAGNMNGGISAAKKALEYQPRFLPAMHNLALAYMRQRQWIRARYWIRQATRVDSDDPTLRRLRLKLRFHTILGIANWFYSKIAKIGKLARFVVGRPTRPTFADCNR